MGDFGYAEALRALAQGAGDTLDRVLAAACAPVPAWDPVLYLADFSRQALLPLAAGVASEDVAGSLPGRAFTTGQPVTADRDGSTRVWVLVVEQTTRTGVLAVTVARAGQDTVGQDTVGQVWTGHAPGTRRRCCCAAGK